MALAPGTLRNLDDAQQRIIILLEDWAPSTCDEIRKDLDLHEQTAKRAITKLAGLHLIHPVGSGWSLTASGRHAADTIKQIGNIVARIGLSRANAGQASNAAAKRSEPLCSDCEVWRPDPKTGHLKLAAIIPAIADEEKPEDPGIAADPRRDEIIRLHLKEGLGVEAIAPLVKAGHRRVKAILLAAGVLHKGYRRRVVSEATGD